MFLAVLLRAGFPPQHPCHIKKEEGGSYGSPPPPLPSSAAKAQDTKLQSSPQTVSRWRNEEEGKRKRKKKVCGIVEMWERDYTADDDDLVWAFLLLSFRRSN